MLIGSIYGSTDTLGERLLETHHLWLRGHACLLRDNPNAIIPTAGFEGDGTKEVLWITHSLLQLRERLEGYDVLEATEFKNDIGLIGKRLSNTQLFNDLKSKDIKGIQTTLLYLRDKKRCAQLLIPQDCKTLEATLVEHIQRGIQIMGMAQDILGHILKMISANSSS